MMLTAVLQKLARAKIDVGIQSSWDDGLNAWLGDWMTKRAAHRTFHATEIKQIAPWLDQEARRLYPDRYK